MMNTPVSICLVEDDAQLLGLLRRLLSKEKNYAVVGAYDSPVSALKQVDWGQVDVLLADLDMPEISGVEVIRTACEANSDLLAIVYTVCENKRMVYAAIQAGAFGYILKSSPLPKILEAISELLAGGSPMSPSIARMVLHDFREENLQQTIAEELSSREVEVLRFIADGLLYKEVADQLGVSVHTVHTLLKRIYAKLHVHNRRAAVRVARQMGQLS